MSSDEVDNSGHDELEAAVAAGLSVILSDERLPGGRFQVAGFVMGGEIILAQWCQDTAGDWHSQQVIFVKRGTLPKLAELLRRTGYHVMPVPDDK